MSNVNSQTRLHNHRSFNNWIKSVLIKTALAQFKRKNPNLSISVMDLGCGKGGDLGKFSFEKISNYLGIDISAGQLQDALFRKINGRINYPMTLIQNRGEASPELFFKNIPEEMFFDLVSAQFCIHYFFETEQNVRNFLTNVSRKLVKEGLFVATLPDADVLLGKLKTGDDEVSDYLVAENDSFSVIIGRDELRKQTPFGLKYGFFLDDDLIGKKEVVNDITRIEYVPEYLISRKAFINLAKEYGLEVVIDQNFHEFYAEKIQQKEYLDLFRKMKFMPMNGDRLMEEDIWDCSYLYR